MGSMSTPINQLPTNVSNEIIQQNSSQLEDPTIADVINEMEREVQYQPRQSQHLQQDSPQNINPNVQHVFQQQYPVQHQQPHPQQHQPHPQQYPQHFQQSHGAAGFNPNHPHAYGYHSSRNQWADWINTPHAQRAILAAFIAAMIFYPFDTGAIYEKIPFFANAHQYDRLIRTLLLAVTLYILLLKLNI
jgi:hypothetical protein